MSRKVAVLFGAILLVVGMTAVSQAALVIQNGTNDLVDESKEVYVDVDHSGTINQGDVIYGLFKISTLNLNSTANTLYIVVSETFAADPTPYAIAGKTMYTFSFTPTTQAGYTLSDLTGGAIASNAFVAVYTDLSGNFSVDLATTPIASTATIDGMIATITSEGTLLASYGIADSKDYFSGSTDALTASIDYVANTALIATLTSSLGTYDAGISVLQDYTPGQLLTGSAGVYDDDTGDYHDGLVYSGTYSGTGTANVFENKLNMYFGANVVPEPASLVIWSLLTGVVGLARIRRRK
jgi:hypothetical protein